MSVYPPAAQVGRGALVTDDGVYRYGLSRDWPPSGEAPCFLPFIMLNPSTADADLDDPTIRKCVGFACRLGYTGIDVSNLYAYRATKPADLRAAARDGIDVVGPSNDEMLLCVLAEAASTGGVVIAAWGSNAPRDRVAEVLALPHADRLYALALTPSGVPRHPLMLGYDIPNPVPLFTGVPA